MRQAAAPVRPQTRVASAVVAIHHYFGNAAVLPKKVRAPEHLSRDKSIKYDMKEIRRDQALLEKGILIRRRSTRKYRGWLLKISHSSFSKSRLPKVALTSSEAREGETPMT